MRLHKGFSLLEILVAFAIMAVALTIVLRIFGSGVNAAVVSEDYTIAVQIAESLMAATGVETPLQEGELSGTEGDRYDWQVRISPVADSADNATQPDQARPVLRLFAVNVQVTWGDDNVKRRRLELHSLKLMQESTP
ncbi:MAG: prepilin-type N-terminal cleavage/methylation domain-containing protein [Methylomonas sp.]|nr:prepilin-type N-terminal cleavage/methylation domain-containing protein [Methylomonas sp.]